MRVIPVIHPHSSSQEPEEKVLFEQFHTQDQFYRGGGPRHKVRPQDVQENVRIERSGYRVHQCPDGTRIYQDHRGLLLVKEDVTGDGGAKSPE